MKYTIDYFIAKFSAIPEDKYCEGSWENGDGRHCADGLCGSRNVYGRLKQTKEGIELAKLLLPLMPEESLTTIIFVINDGYPESPYYQPTPKQRILAALMDIKKLQDGDVGKAESPKPEKTKTVYVSVPTSITEQADELILS